MIFSCLLNIRVVRNAKYSKKCSIYLKFCVFLIQNLFPRQTISALEIHSQKMQLFSRLEFYQPQKILPFEVRFFVGLCQFIKFSIKKGQTKKKIFEAIRFIRLNPTVFQKRNENKQFIFSNLFTVWMTYSLCYFYINWNGTKFEIFSRKIFTLNLNFLENTLRVRLLNASMC